MACDIVFRIGNKEIKINNTNITSQDNSIEKVAMVLMENQEQWNDLQQTIKTAQTQEMKYVTAEDIEREGLMGNLSLDSLISEYKQVQWPENVTDFSMNILLVNNLKYNGKRTYGRVIDKYGNELFILQNNQQSIQRFANYLKVRTLIEAYTEEDEELAAILQGLKNLWGKEAPSSIKEMLLDYQNDSLRYSSVILDNVDVFGVLKDVLRGLQEYNEQRIYNDEFVNSIVSRLKRRANVASISRKQFVELLWNIHPEIAEDIKQKTGLSKTKLQSDDEALAEVINTYFLEAESELNYDLQEITSKNIVFSSVPKTLDNRYGFTYDTINDLVFPANPPTYKGYNIYQYNDNGTIKYLYDRNILTTKSYSRLVGSYEEAIANIDRKIKITDKLLNNSEIDFKLTPINGQKSNYFYTKKYYTEGSLVKSLDINIDTPSGKPLPDEEMQLVQEKYLQNFYKHIEKILPQDLYQKALEVLDDTEKAVTFLYMLRGQIGWSNDFNQEQLGEIDNILNRINEAPYKYYYIEKRVGPVQGGYYVRVIPTNNKVELDPVHNRPSPVITQINDIVDTLNKKFNLDATVLTADEVSQMGVDAETAKAFIKDGKIYINGALATSSDVVHEYTHLFLGILKAKNYDIYQSLLDRLINSNDKRVRSTVIELRRIYPNLSRNDLYEEVFVKLFSDFLSGKNQQAIFKEAKNIIDRDLKNSIFNLASPTDFDKIYSRNMYSMFNQFSTDVGNLARTSSDLDFNVGAIYRKAANWIEDKISKGELEERC